MTASASDLNLFLQSALDAGEHDAGGPATNTDRCRADKRQSLLVRAIGDIERFGGALLLCSACEAVTEEELANSDWGHVSPLVIERLSVAGTGPFRPWRKRVERKPTDEYDLPVSRGSTEAEKREKCNCVCCQSPPLGSSEFSFSYSWAEHSKFSLPNYLQDNLWKAKSVRAVAPCQCGQDDSDKHKPCKCGPELLQAQRGFDTILKREISNRDFKVIVQAVGGRTQSREAIDFQFSWEANTTTSIREKLDEIKVKKRLNFWESLSITTGTGEELVVSPLKDGGRSFDMVREFREEDFMVFVHVDVAVGKLYHDQALMGAAVVEQSLCQAGVPRELIKTVDFVRDDRSPSEVVREFFCGLDMLKANALVYFCGPADADGRWAFGWRGRVYGEYRSELLGPDELSPHVGAPIGPPGSRLVVADAPGTAKLWIRPRTRQACLAAWRSLAAPGGSRAPPLTRWLCGSAPAEPEGVVTVAPPEHHGLWQLPAYLPIFWSQALEPLVLADGIWELDAFVSTNPRKEIRATASSELVGWGGAELLKAVLHEHVFGEDLVLLRALRVLHNIVVNSALARWLGTMPELLATCLWLLDSRPDRNNELLTGILGLLAACATMCSECRHVCAEERRSEILMLALKIFDEGEGPALVAVCKLIVQVITFKPLDAKEDCHLLNQLQGLLEPKTPDCTGSIVQEAASDALLFAALKCNNIKKKLLKDLGRSRSFLHLLETCDPTLVARLLALLRVLVAVEPSSRVAKYLAPEVPDIVVHALCVHPLDADVQRWGLAALGAVAVAAPEFVEKVAEGASICVVWSLSTDDLSAARHVQQEALFCAHALVKTAEGLAHLGNPDVALAQLAAAVVSVSIHDGTGSSEIPLWGLRVLERMSSCEAGVPLVAPHVGIILDAVMNGHCRADTAIAGCGALTFIIAVSQPAFELVLARRVALIKSLQRLARESRKPGSGGLQSRTVELELRDWIKVLMEAMGLLKVNPEDDGQEENEEVEEGFDDNASNFSYVPPEKKRY